MDEPLFKKLIELNKRNILPMHMPGHKRNVHKFPWIKEIDLSLDITEIQGFDDLNSPGELFGSINSRLAALRRAKKSVALVNGSTGGILAAFKLCLPAEGKALIARNSHKCVYAAAESSGAELSFVIPEYIRELNAFGEVKAEKIDAALSRDKSIGLVCITSPTYEGVVSDISAISKVCRKHGVPLLTDAAHGAHFGFGEFPKGAIELGADIAVESLHKTLPSPTQTAVLSFGEGMPGAEKAQRCVSLFQSSSPSYILTAGIDACVSFLEADGAAEAEKWRKMVLKLREELKKLKNFRLFEAENCDVSKIVLECGNGYDAAELFRKEGVELEMASSDYVLAMTGMGDTDETLRLFLRAAEKVDGLISGPAYKEKAFALPDRPLSFCDAIRAEAEIVPLDRAAGRISAEYLWKYPPGCPIVIPGEIIDEGVIKSSDKFRSSYGRLSDGVYCVKQ